MTPRTQMLVGGSVGTLWALLIVWLPGQGAQPFIPLNLALIYALVPVGLIMAMMMGRIALRRYFNEALQDGDPPLIGSAAEIDIRVLRNTVEQAVLALLLWPFIATSLGSVTVIVMGIGFAIARLAYWIGYRVSPPLRLFGFAASFYPTVLGALWSLWRVLT